MLASRYSIYSLCTRTRTHTHTHAPARCTNRRITSGPAFASAHCHARSLMAAHLRAKTRTGAAVNDGRYHGRGGESTRLSENCERTALTDQRSDGLNTAAPKWIRPSPTEETHSRGTYPNQVEYLSLQKSKFSQGASPKTKTHLGAPIAIVERLGRRHNAGRVKDQLPRGELRDDAHE